ARLELTAFTLRRASAGEGWVKLGTVQLRSRDLAGAEKSFNEALRDNPRHVEALNGLGVALFQRNRQRDAVQCFSNALRARPDYPPALLNSAIASQTFLNNRSDALEKYEEYLALPVHGPEWEAVSVMARALETEAAAAARPAPLPAQPPPPVPKPATNSLARPAVSRPDAAIPNRPPPSTSTPATVEAIRLPPEPVIKSAPEVTTSAPAASRPVAATNAAAQAAEKRNVLSRMFHRDSKTNAPAVNVARTEAPKA